MHKFSCTTVMVRVYSIVIGTCWKDATVPAMRIKVKQVDLIAQSAVLYSRGRKWQSASKLTLIRLFSRDSDVR